MAKRKRPNVAQASTIRESMTPPIIPLDDMSRKRAAVEERVTPANIKSEQLASPLSDAPDPTVPVPKKKQARKSISFKAEAEGANGTAASKPAKEAADGDEMRGDPETDDTEEDADPEEIKAASLRPRPVNSDYLPLPWKGRLGYACLCTYLRSSNPTVFSSRTTRIASILEHRHPLKDPSKPEHATKNRPDKDQPADIRRGQEFIEKLCLANVADMAKMIRWNDRYGIRFLRLSSEAFPFASHPEYGYKLAPFAADALAKVGKVAADVGHRLTTHPGQFTQLGSPRASVIEASIRDLEYHNEMLSLLKLPPQQDRDAVMILHMGGMFGDKPATLDRFRRNYARLSDGIKRRLVLENDDVCWSVHDLLPICQELDIPLCLDWHHNNIIFDETQMREGTLDVRALFPEISATWARKRITQKMHYSEPTPAAVTGKQRRKHSPRVATLPPCPDDMDLMIEAKDKEQAVFELMRTFKLPGWDTFNDVVPHVRQDDNKPVPVPPKKKEKKKAEDDEDDDEPPRVPIPDHEVGMGGPEGRVYWPPGMEEWLRPVKRVAKKKEAAAGGSGSLTPAQKKIAVALAKSEIAAEMKAKKTGSGVVVNGDAGLVNGDLAAASSPAGKKNKAKAKPTTKRAARVKREAAPATSDDEVAETGVRATKGRRTKAARVTYADEDEEE